MGKELREFHCMLGPMEIHPLALEACEAAWGGNIACGDTIGTGECTKDGAVRWE